MPCGGEDDARDAWRACSRSRKSRYEYSSDDSGSTACSGLAPAYSSSSAPWMRGHRQPTHFAATLSSPRVPSRESGDVASDATASASVACERCASTAARTRVKGPPEMCRAVFLCALRFGFLDRVCCPSGKGSSVLPSVCMCVTNVPSLSQP